MSSRVDEESLMSSMLIDMLISMLLMSSILISMLISMLLISSMLISMLISMLLLSSLHWDSYIKVLVVPQGQMMSGHHRVNIKVFQCPDCGKEFTRKVNMERYRIVSHGDSNSEADSEEYFDHVTEASDEHDISDEQQSIADEETMMMVMTVTRTRTRMVRAQIARIVQMMKTKMTMYGVA